MSQLTLKTRIKNAVNLIESHVMILGNDQLMGLCNKIEDERIKRLQDLQKEDISKINKISVKD